MGLGDRIMMTAVIKAVIEHTEYEAVRIWRIKKGQRRNVTKMDIFKYNPYVARDNDSRKTFELCIGDARERKHYNYLIKVTNTGWTFADEHVHVVEQMCKHFKICQKPTDLRGEVYFIKSEIDRVKKILERNKLEKYVVIEPHSKSSYRGLPFSKFQQIVNQYHQKIKFVQIGIKDKKKLKNVINLTGLSLRESALIIKFAKLIICPEGGLMHLSHALKTPGIIIIPGFLNPAMVCYPTGHYNISIAEHPPCHLFKCKKCDQEKTLFNPVQKVFPLIDQLLST